MTGSDTRQPAAVLSHPLQLYLVDLSEAVSRCSHQVSSELCLHLLCSSAGGAALVSSLSHVTRHNDISDRGGGPRGRGRGRGWGRGRGHAQSDDLNEQRDSRPLISSTSPSPLSALQQRFYQYSQTLDANNDKRERIHQTARDLIKAAKRDIFALQRPMTQQQLSIAGSTISSSATASHHLQTQTAALFLII
jgi:hypothetical protein